MPDRVLIFVGCRHVDAVVSLTRGGVASEMTISTCVAIMCAGLQVPRGQSKASYIGTHTHTDILIDTLS